MLRSLVVRVVSLVVCLAMVTAAFAADGTIVRYVKGQVTVKVDKQDFTADVKDIKVLEFNGKPVASKDLADLLKKDTKVDATVQGGKLKEIKLLMARD
jgi:hypothetical protein